MVWSGDIDVCSTYCNRISACTYEHIRAADADQLQTLLSSELPTYLFKTERHLHAHPLLSN